MLLFYVPMKEIYKVLLKSKFLFLYSFIFVTLSKYFKYPSNIYNEVLDVNIFNN